MEKCLFEICIDGVRSGCISLQKTASNAPSELVGFFDGIYLELSYVTGLLQLVLQKACLQFARVLQVNALRC